MTSESLAQEARRRGNAARVLHRYVEAMAALDDAILLSPGDIMAWHDRGALMLELDEPGQALRDFEAGLVLAPCDGRLLSGKAAALLALARPADALGVINTVMALEPQIAGLHELRATALCGLGRLEEAIIEQRLALSRSLADGRCHYNLGWLLEQAGAMDEAAGCYHTAITLLPDCEPAMRGQERVRAALNAPRRR